MARGPLSLAVDAALMPARVTLRVARGLLGGDEPAPPPARPARPPEPPPPPPRPKDLDDVTIAHKVESALFRDRKIAKGKVDVNVAEGVVWLRGEVRTPELHNEAEARARAVPEVRGVENLLHLPKTPAPTRTDTPAPERKTRRHKAKPSEQKLMPADVTDEAPEPPGAEPSPRDRAAAHKGRKPAPLGSQGDEPRESEGPDAADLDRDPAYNPTDPALKDLKGG
jgi:hypothetical protein